MPKAYSEDLRQRVLDFLAEGGRPLEAVRQFKVCRGSVYLWRQQAKAGRKKAFPQGRKRGVSKVAAGPLKDYIKEHPDQTLAEIGECFGVSGVMIWKRLKQLNYTFKKRAFSTKNATKPAVANSAAK